LQNRIRIDDGWMEVDVPRIDDHEVVAVDLA